MPPENEQPQVSDLRKDMIATFSTESGEKVFAWLLDQCGFVRTINVIDPYEVMLWEGRRSVVVDMLREMQDTRLKDRQRAITSLEPPVYAVTETADTDG